MRRMVQHVPAKDRAINSTYQFGNGLLRRYSEANHSVIYGRAQILTLLRLDGLYKRLDHDQPARTIPVRNLARHARPDLKARLSADVV